MLSQLHTNIRPLLEYVVSAFADSHHVCEVLKNTIRNRVLSARRSMSSEERQQADGMLLVALAEHLAAASGTGPLTIAGYLPMRAEPGGAGLPDLLLDHSRGGRLLLPHLREDRDLDWYARPGPAAHLLGVEAIGQADLVVVPAVAVDRTGIRLGRGGGSYDRALARVRPEVEVIALLYPGELVDELPALAHDQPVSSTLVVDDRATRWTRTGRMPHH